MFNVITTLGVAVYGELEYFFGMFKFLSLAVLFFLSILANVGAFGNGYVGFRYWRAPSGNTFFTKLKNFFNPIRPYHQRHQWLWPSVRSSSSILRWD